MALLKRPLFKFILLFNLTFTYAIIYGMPANLSSQAQHQHLPAGFSLVNLTSFSYIYSLLLFASFKTDKWTDKFNVPAPLLFF